MYLNLPFEQRSRVKYRTNPLIEVVCQFRFPRLLRLEAQPPADFQDEIKSEFPILKESSGFEVAMAFTEGAASAPSIKQVPVKSYDFFSSDSIWRVGIASTSFSLTCQKYQKWEEFKGRLDKIRSVFVKIYQPPYIERCGLRYINVIDPFVLGLDETDFSKLISAKLVGEQYKELLGGNNLREFGGNYSVALSDTGHFLRVNYGLVKHPQEKRNGFKIDSDFWIEGKLEANGNDITESLEKFHSAAGSLFQNSIEKELYEALGPEQLS